MAILENDTRVIVPDSTFVEGRAVGQRTASVTVTAEYTNYTSGTIYAKTQANMPFAIDPATTLISGAEARPHLEVKMSYLLHNNSGILGTLEILRALSENDHLQSQEAEKLYDRIQELYRKDGSRSSKTNFTFVVIRRVMETDIDRSRAVYFKECDLILTKEREMLVKPHPNSAIGLQQSDLLGNRRDVGQAGIVVKVIDNERIAETRYYFAGKQLVTVPSMVDVNAPSGVYYTIATQGEDGSVAPVTKCIPFDEAKEVLGLYEFKEDALSHGNPDLFLKAEESRHRAEERRTQLELARAKSQNDTRSAELERELLEVRRALELQKSQNEAIKDNLALGKTVREDVADQEKRKRERDRAKDEAKKERKKLKAEQKKFKMDLVKLRREQEKLEQDRLTEQEKLRVEREKAEMDAERRRRDDYYDRLDKERRDHFESRSHERKDTSELIKFVPAVILGVVGTIAVLKAKS